MYKKHFLLAFYLFCKVNSIYLYYSQLASCFKYKFDFSDKTKTKVNLYSPFQLSLTALICLQTLKQINLVENNCGNVEQCTKVYTFNIEDDSTIYLILTLKEGDEKKILKIPGSKNYFVNSQKFRCSNAEF